MPGYIPIITPVESLNPSSRRGSRSTELSQGSDRSGSVASSTTSLTHRKARRQEKVHLQEVEQTLLITLFWRSLDAQSAHPILGCRRAGEVLARLEDVDWLEGTYGTDPRWVSYVAGRTARLDAWTAEFLAAWPGRQVTVLHLACGLDSRDRRVTRDPELVRWVDVDRPLVANLRERVMLAGTDYEDDEGLDETSLRPVGDYSLRTLNVTEGRWYSDIPADRPTLVVAEGLFPYLTPAEAEGVIKGLADYFGQGQLMFDTVGSLAVSHTKRVNVLKPSGSRFQWGVDDARDVLAFHEKLRLRDQVRWYEFMGVKGDISRETAPPWFGPKAMTVAQYTSSFKDNGQVLRFDF
ncbi:O-methyltransferase [Diaporthe helianthi]|uniref:O-methyltransferase n=1 Tax=Diaporthe helianthi TaxID=158607 RepID=A0A2P5HXE4_DIAHE|nr:O-methyltransferase [Diaporthe helianthi]